jgi:hypothetical protein
MLKPGQRPHQLQHHHLAQHVGVHIGIGVDHRKTDPGLRRQMHHMRNIG